MIINEYTMQEILKYLTDVFNELESENGKYTYTLVGDIIYQKLADKIYKNDESLGAKFVWIEYPNGNRFLHARTSQISKYVSDNGVYSTSSRQPMYDCEYIELLLHPQAPKLYNNGYRINKLLLKK